MCYERIYVDYARFSGFNDRFFVDYERISVVYERLTKNGDIHQRWMSLTNQLFVSYGGTCYARIFVIDCARFARFIVPISLFIKILHQKTTPQARREVVR